MLGASYVRYETEVDNIEPWTESAVEDLIKGTTNDDRGAQQTFIVLLESHNRRVLGKVAGYLGEEEDTSGGTIGAPRTPVAWMKILNSRFMDSLREQQNFHSAHTHV